MSFRLIVGLGNPGSEYDGTRHNVGFRVLDAFALNRKAEAWKKERKLKCFLAQCGIPGLGSFLLAKPTTYMNDSGSSIQKLSSFYKIPPEEVVVVYDEINLPVGECKLSLSGGAGGHNGVADILSKIAPRFARFRVGIGGKPIKEMPLYDYVLGKFSSDEEQVVAANMDRFVEGVELLLRHGPDLAMNQINRKRQNDDSNSMQL